MIINEYALVIVEAAQIEGNVFLLVHDLFKMTMVECLEQAIQFQAQFRGTSMNAMCSPVIPPEVVH